MTEWLPEWTPGLLKSILNQLFVAEFKGDTSMEIVHQQARLDGGIAAQAF
jgi:hypothetical protein